MQIFERHILGARCQSTIYAPLVQTQPSSPHNHQVITQRRHKFSIYEISQKKHSKMKSQRSIIISRKVVIPPTTSLSQPKSHPITHLTRLLLPRIIKHPSSKNIHLSVRIQPHHPFRTTFPTPAPSATDRGISIIIAARLASRANGNRNTLYRAAMFVATRVHAVIDGEVAADQIGAHGCIFARQGLGFVDDIRLVFAVVDPRNACVPSCCGVSFVGWFWPAAAATEAWTVLIGLLLWGSMLGIERLELVVGLRVKGRSCKGDILAR